MFHGTHRENLRRAFAAQFEPSATGYLYRHGGYGAPVQVTGAERDAFITAFDRRMRWGWWGAIAVMIAVSVGGAITASGDEPPDAWVFVFGLALGLGMLGCYYWARAAPTRELARRPVVGNPLSKSERRRRSLARLSWRMLATGAGAVIALIALLIGAGSVWRDPGVAFGVVLLVLFAVQGARKWRAQPR